jgi:hypothetical protein
LRVQGPIASKAIPIAADDILIAAASQQTPSMRAGSTVDLVPTAAMHSNSLLQVADPKLTKSTGRTTEEAAAACSSSTAKTFVDGDVNRNPRPQVIKSEGVLVRAVAGQASPFGRLREEPFDNTIMLGKGRDGRQQPTVTNSTLKDILWIGMVKELYVWDISDAMPSPRK